MVGHKSSYPVYAVTDVTSLGSVLRSDFPSFAVNCADIASSECVPATVPPSQIKQPTPKDHARVCVCVGVCGKCTELREGVIERQTVDPVGYISDSLP